MARCQRSGPVGSTGTCACDKLWSIMPREGQSISILTRVGDLYWNCGWLTDQKVLPRGLYSVHPCYPWQLTTHRSNLCQTPRRVPGLYRDVLTRTDCRRGEGPTIAAADEALYAVFGQAWFTRSTDHKPDLGVRSEHRLLSGPDAQIGTLI